MEIIRVQLMFRHLLWNQDTMFPLITNSWSIVQIRICSTKRKPALKYISVQIAANTILKPSKPSELIAFLAKQYGNLSLQMDNVFPNKIVRRKNTHLFSLLGLLSSNILSFNINVGYMNFTLKRFEEPLKNEMIILPTLCNCKTSL